MQTLIIGAGPAGLAVAASLRAADVDATIVERADAVGSSWRGHYERLHLHTDRAHSELPGLGFPAGTPRWPSRRQVIDYLEAYARHHAIDVRFGERVVKIDRDPPSGWRVATERGEHPCKHVVIATGYPRVPVVPEWPGRFAGPIVHSSAYANGAPFRDKRVLVVGFGNSGGEIAIDLHEHGARVAIAVRSPVNVIPREVLGLPVLAIGIATAWMPPRLADAISAPIIRATIGDIRELGFRKLPYGPMVQITKHGRIPLIDIGTIALIRAGAISLFPGVRALWERGVELADGRREEVDAIVAATGYRPALEELVPDLAHLATARSGRELAPGLYACGFYVAPTGMLREIGLEAARIARAIAVSERSGRTRAARR